MGILDGLNGNKTIGNLKSLQRGVDPGTRQVIPQSSDIIYNSYAGTDIVAEIVLPGDNEVLTLGELQTISYSSHRENSPVRIVGHVNPVGFVKGPRTISGSLIFTVFNEYAFYRLDRYRNYLKYNMFPLADMMPPFDITITFSNEYGSAGKMRIYGVTIVDEGGTMSVDDLITESTYTYMARAIHPLIATNRNIAAVTQPEVNPSVVSDGIHTKILRF